ncbi:hypothetical protein PYW08_004459 [Mythimna loreyi]|uniref:Uncharacterized protein n=1 Tax=Mythimna loreyi TaxID=667449 RepID=A0ACC2QRI3_9NEOP|nr:hypothetical protein PYW08_004459 [Mythimna loreyi]
MASTAVQLNRQVTSITDEDINLILTNYNRTNEEIFLQSYTVHSASDKILGFQAEYWKMKVHLSNGKVLYFFIKSIPRSNAAKANMVKEMQLFEKETFFYSVIKENIEIPDLKPWSARLITSLNDAMVFEDLNAKQYKLRNKFSTLDMAHTLQALKTLARFHASSIIYEEKKRKETLGEYKGIYYEYETALHLGEYHLATDFFFQCMTGALEAMKSFSKYDDTEMNLIESRWRDVWSTALSLGGFSSHQRNVVCHRDLWNNNLMFHYSNHSENRWEPDDCVLVDFQDIGYSPPAADVMLLLCCNLNPTFREKNIDVFLNVYFVELKKILDKYNIEINEIFTKEEFIASAEEQRLWGLTVCACLLPHSWLDDEVTTENFSDNARFEQIFFKNRGEFIKKMMEINFDYRQKIMGIFEEIANRYCLCV